MKLLFKKKKNFNSTLLNYFILVNFIISYCTLDSLAVIFHKSLFYLLILFMCINKFTSILVYQNINMNINFVQNRLTYHFKIEISIKKEK